MTGPTVLFVAGEGRSGSTLLGRLLDQHSGIFTAGEMRYLWSRGLIDEEDCQCGRPFPQCAFWKTVLASAYDGADRPAAGTVVAWDRRVVRLRYLPLTLLQTWCSWATSRQLEEYRVVLRRVYHSVASVCGGSLVVDTSKVPAYALVLRSTPDVDVFVVHLVRDPRGTAFSWTRRKPERGPAAATMRTHGPLTSAVQWVIWNVLTEALLRRRHRYLRIRYEDLVSSPEAVTARIIGFVTGRPPVPSDAGHGDLIRSAPGHMAWGNPDRFSEGTLSVRLDDEWLHKLTPRAQRLVSAVTLPLLWRYGYPVAPLRAQHAKS